MPKKKQTKKHKFKHGEQSAGVISPAESGAISKPKAVVSGPSISKQTTGSGSITARDFSYVASDLRKILVLALSLLGLELVLWFLFAHTGLGNTVYNSIQP